jgi:hypothetical protein
MPLHKHLSRSISCAVQLLNCPKCPQGSNNLILCDVGCFNSHVGQKVFNHSHYLFHESGLLNEMLLTYMAVESSGGGGGRIKSFRRFTFD